MTAGGKMVWTGRVISGLLSLLFAMSAIMKFRGGAEVGEGMAHLGLSESLIVPLGILEISCVGIYLIPATSIMGAILLPATSAEPFWPTCGSAIHSSSRS